MSKASILCFGGYALTVMAICHAAGVPQWGFEEWFGIILAGALGVWCGYLDSEGR